MRLADSKMLSACREAVGKSLLAFLTVRMRKLVLFDTSENSATSADCCRYLYSPEIARPARLNGAERVNPIALKTKAPARRTPSGPSACAICG